MAISTLPGLDAVIDISHHNGHIDFDTVAVAGVIGVIQKATEGTDFTDKSLAGNRMRALAAGLRFGTYHFGTASDPIAQAEHYLAVVTPQPGELIALDFEKNELKPANTMSLDQARAFISHLFEKLPDRVPGFYSGDRIKQTLGDEHDPLLARCWLWLAQYGTTPVVPANWSRFTLWQYTDGSLGPLPHTVPGITGRCDRDRFNGTAEELRTFWASA